MSRIIILAVIVSATSALAQTRQFYDADGNYLGQSMPSGSNARVYYDPNGNVAATGMRAGQNTMFYGSDGSFIGTVQNAGPMSDN